MSEAPPDKNIIPKGTIVNGYRVVCLIAISDFSAIYQVRDKKTGQIYAMKTEDFDTKRITLPDEINIIKELKTNYFPKYHEAGNIEKYQVNYLITSFLGISCGQIQTFNAHKINLEVSYNLGYKMFLALKTFHKLGFVHQDVKPDTFLLQQNPEFPLALIDFNLSKRFIEPISKEPIPCQKLSTFIGTKKYASVNSLSLLSSGRNDDLISWFYSFLDLACGSLPWEDETSIKKIISMKESFSLSDLRYKLPKEFQQIYDYLKNLIYDNEPDYDMIQTLFEEGMRSDNRDPSKFDWEDFIAKYTNIIDFEARMKRMETKYQNYKQERLKQRKLIENRKSRRVTLNDMDNSERKHSKKSRKRSCLIQ